MKAFIRGKMYLGLLMVVAASLWLAGCILRWQGTWMYRMNLRN